MPHVLARSAVFLTSLTADGTWEHGGPRDLFIDDTPPRVVKLLLIALYDPGPTEGVDNLT